MATPGKICRVLFYIIFLPGCVMNESEKHWIMENTLLCGKRKMENAPGEWNSGMPVAATNNFTFIKEVPRF